MSCNRLLALVLAASFTSVSPAVTIYVDDDNCPGPGDGSAADPFCSIQAAIVNAMNDDVIVVAPGTYFETINFLGKAVTVWASDGPSVTTIDGLGTGAVVTCASGEGPGSVLDGFTITGGTGDTSLFGYPLGGGMFNMLSDPSVANCIFENNTAWFGGGMYNEHASPTVTGCVFSGNQTLVGDGGGMHSNVSSPLVVDCLFSGNTSAFGSGGMFNGAGAPTVIRCTFLDNTAPYTGGGMSNGNSDALLVDCLFAGNSAGLFGGAIEHSASAGTLTLVNCTLTENDAFVQGGGIDVFWGSMQVSNCIAWNNSDAYGTGESSQINDPLGGTTVNYSCIQGGWTGAGSNNIASSPQFVDPFNGDFRLAAGSPCIDAADNAAVPVGITTDLDGNPRFVDDPATADTGNGDPPVVDMGAYEYQVPPVVAALDIKPGDCPNELDRTANGVLSAAVVGSEEFDVAQIDLDTILLARVDGVGGSIPPLNGPPGPHTTLEDVTAPFAGEACDCDVLPADGIMDLSLKFWSHDVAEALELDDLPDGESVELTVSGMLLDGTAFVATDCITLVSSGD